MVLDDMLLRSTQLWPGVDAIAERGRSVTTAELAAEVALWARRLAGLQVRAGDRVSIACHNRIEYAALYFSVARVGAVAVAHNWRLLPAEMAEQIRDADSRIVIADAHSASDLGGLCGDLPGVSAWVDLDGATEGWLGPDEIELAPVTPHRPSEHDVVVMMFTSGTTGRAKGAMLSHRNLCHMVLAWSLEMPLRGAQTRFLQVTPLFHVGGLMMVLLNVARGSTLLLEPDFTPGDAVRRLLQERATHALFVPAMIRWMLLDPVMRGAEFPDLELILYGASPMPVEHLRQAIDAFGCGFLHAYGLTETSGVVTALQPEEHVYALAEEPELLTSAGRVMMGCAVRILTPEGEPVPTGELGEIVCRGPNVFVGYRGRPEATADALRDGWLWTGDIGRMDARGYLTIVDRSKDMIIVGGENVYPSEVEATLRAVPGLSDLAVIGIPHSVWGEQVLVVAVPEQGADDLSQRLIDHARAHLARFKCPTQVVLADALPRTPAGKVQKSVLRAPYWADLNREI